MGSCLQTITMTVITGVQANASSRHMGPLIRWGNPPKPLTGAPCLRAPTHSQLSENEDETKAAWGERVEEEGGRKRALVDTAHRPFEEKGWWCNGLKQPAMMIITRETCWQTGVGAGLSSDPGETLSWRSSSGCDAVCRADRPGLVVAEGQWKRGPVRPAQL